MPGRPSLNPLLASRWSPRSFDASYDITDDEVEVLLEAARWAPSAGNSQPRAFIVGRRGDAIYERLVRHLAGSSAGWAPTASLLIANLAHRFVEDTDWEYSEFSLYDLGQVVAHLTVQAQALGLSSRQFRAFDREQMAAEFAVPDHWEVSTMVAIGRAAPACIPPSAELAQPPARARRAVDEIIWPAD